MKLIELSAILLAFIFFNVYIYINLLDLSSGGGTAFIILFFILTIPILILSSFHHRSIKVSTIVLFLLIFWITFSSVSVNDNFTTLKTNVTGTKNGILFGLVLGVMVSSVASRLYYLLLSSSHYVVRFIVFLIFVFLLSGLIQSIGNLYNFLGFLRSDMFKISEFSGEYQRPAILMLMQTSIYSIILFSKRCATKVIGARFGKLTVIVFIIDSLLKIITAQLIGSNSGSITIFSVMFLTVYSLLAIDRLDIRFKLKNLLFSKFSSPLIISFSFILLFLVLVLNSDYATSLNIRMLGPYGIVSSLSSRFEIIYLDLFEHLSYNIIFGYPLVHEVVGESGIYVHSFISIATHYGLLALMLFLFFLLISFYERGNYCRYCLSDFSSLSEFRMFGYYFFLMMFTFALVSTFVAWPPIWFTIGAFIVRPPKTNYKFNYG